VPCDGLWLGAGRPIARGEFYSKGPSRRRESGHRGRQCEVPRHPLDGSSYQTHRRDGLRSSPSPQTRVADRSASLKSRTNPAFPLIGAGEVIVVIGMPHRGPPVHRAAGRIARDLRRPGRYRHREHSPVRRSASADTGACQDCRRSRIRQRNSLALCFRPTSLSVRARLSPDRMDTKGRAESLMRCGPRRISHPSRTASSSTVEEFLRE